MSEQTNHTPATMTAKERALLRAKTPELFDRFIAATDRLLVDNLPQLEWGKRERAISLRRSLIGDVRRFRIDDITVRCVERDVECFLAAVTAKATQL
jgi:hypothetical protein